MSETSGNSPITKILTDLKMGGDEAYETLFPLVYDELRKIAGGYFSRERSDHTLQPTALVHEAFLRLSKQSAVDFESRTHFFGVAARLMREILIDHARRHNSQKRGGESRTRITLDGAVDFGGKQQLDVLAVDEALTKLEDLDDRQARIVEMKFFAGLNVDEIATVLEISPATVKREWSSAKLFLSRMLKSEN
ncbi:MAG TPA: sigma-70 family RNA polymerase sigma factor [Pyrinomonadaceae bacterium]|nr:sigma-70 family RNA polymerase sigma factor [Pyrinomonadaceae bacterium]